MLQVDPCNAAFTSSFYGQHSVEGRGGEGRGGAIGRNSKQRSKVNHLLLLYLVEKHSRALRTIYEMLFSAN